MTAMKDKVLLKDWLAFHPYESAVQSELYYLRICNEILGVLLAEGMDYWENLLDREELKELACFLTCYFEDVISGPGLWRCFTAAMEELYDYPLPYFRVDKDYLPEEINKEDVCFLLWYFVSMKRGDEFMVSPIFYELSDLPEGTMDILEREYEQAPENRKLQALYDIPKELDDLSDLNALLRQMLLKSWLFFFHGEEMEGILKNQIKKWDKDGPAPHMMDMYIYDMTDSYVHSTRTSLLAFHAKEWLAILAGKDHPRYKDIRGLGEKKSGYYLFEGFVKGENGLFRHLATDRVLEVSERSMDFPPDLESGRSVIYAGFVQWGEFWWLTGSMLHYSKNQKEDVNSELLDKERLLFSDLEGLQAKENGLLSSAFLKFNEGKPMAFRANMDEMNAFVIEFLEYYAGDKRVVSYADPSKGNVPEDVPGMLFCSAVSGIHTVFGLNSCIPDEENPWYDEAEAEDDTERLLHSPYITGEWMHHLLENYHLPVPEFPGIRETHFVVDNLDFLLRFWKRRAY
jgi:hypothetical protein